MIRLANHWYIAAAAGELGETPLRRDVEGETLVLWRDGEGQPRAMVDRCAHRGMALSRGRVDGGCLSCPYHGWKYDSAGRVCAVPSLMFSEALPHASMRTFPIIEQDDQLWVWIGDDEAKAKPPSFPHHDEPGWTSFFMQTRFGAEVEDCIENFLDVPHTLHVHPGLFRRGKLSPTRTRVRREAGSVVAEFLDETNLDGWGPRLLFPRGTTMRHTDRFMLPSITRVDYAFGDEHGFVITSQCTQRDSLVVDVTTHISWRLPLWSALARPFLRWYCRRVIQQDVDTLAVIGEQTRTFGRSHLHTKADLLGRHIARLRRDAVCNRPSEPLVTETTIQI